MATNSRVKVKRPSSSSSASVDRNKKRKSSVSVCEICVETTDNDRMFRTQRCGHSFCNDCLTKYVRTKIQERNHTVRCPGVNCKVVLELEACRAMLPKELIDKWEELLCEGMIGEEQKFYCPFKDCSGMLVKDDGDLAIRESECPFCHRLFCAQCCVPWHSGVDCKQFRALNKDKPKKDDLMVIELAKREKWMRCPKCKFFVERTAGCPHMTCRCKFQFCYGCGSEWSKMHYCNQF